MGESGNLVCVPRALYKLGSGLVGLGRYRLLSSSFCTGTRLSRAFSEGASVGGSTKLQSRKFSRELSSSPRLCAREAVMRNTYGRRKVRST